MKILAIAGSPRRKGNSNYLVDVALKAAEKLGAETEKIVLSDFKVAPCQGHNNCGSRDTCVQKDDANWILDRLCEADGVIFSTPVYYYNVSAQLKALIDRTYFLYMHDRKPKSQAVGLIVVAESAGIEDTLHTLNQYVDETFSEKKVFTVSGYAGRCGEVKNNAGLVQEAEKLGRQMVEALR